MFNNKYSEIAPIIDTLVKKCEIYDKIDASLYTEYDVKRGLRDINGKGVVAGLTEISEVCSSEIKDGKSVPCRGKLLLTAELTLKNWWAALSAASGSVLRKPCIF